MKNNKERHRISMLTPVWRMGKWAEPILNFKNKSTDKIPFIMKLVYPVLELMYRLGNKLWNIASEEDKIKLINSYGPKWENTARKLHLKDKDGNLYFK